MVFKILLITVLPTRESRATYVDLKCAVVTVIERYLHLVREPYSDRISGGRLTGYAWSALRILRIVGMESEDNKDLYCGGGEA